MTIIVSADSFASFTSGFPVRGMMLELIKMRSQDKFVLYYTKRPTPKSLDYFYEHINSLPNVEVRYFKYNRKIVELRRMFGLSLINKTDEFNVFINPGRAEFWRGLNIPQICSIADLSSIKGAPTHRNKLMPKAVDKFLMHYKFKHITKLVSISKFTESDILSLWPEFSGKTEVVYNGIDNFWFENEDVDSEIKPFDGKPYFIWWGLISKRKNIERLIEAYNNARKIDASIPNLLLVGGIEQSMRHVESHFNENIFHLPFSSNKDIKHLVRNSSGLIFPSLYEGFGLPIIEAMSQGVNVACSNITSLPEVADGHALLFDPLDVDELCAAIIKLANYKIDMPTLINHAEKFTYKNAAQKYSTILDSVV